MEPYVAGAVTAFLSAVGGSLATHYLEKASRNESQQENRRKRESQISIDAFALRRQLQSWFRDSHSLSGEVERSETWAKAIAGSFATADERVSRIAVATAELSTERADDARRAYVTFHQVLNSFSAAAAEASFSRNGSQVRS